MAAEQLLGAQGCSATCLPSLSKPAPWHLWCTPSCLRRGLTPSPPPALSVLCYGGGIAIAGLLYHWFAPGGHDCSFNITIITVALILCVAFSLMSMHPAVSACCAC